MMTSRESFDILVSVVMHHGKMINQSMNHSIVFRNIDNDKKVNVFFLAVIGPDAYKLLKNLCD